MIDPRPEDIGRKVVYRARFGLLDVDVAEEGVITSINNDYVFVRYGHDSASKATHRRDLEWMDRTMTDEQRRAAIAEEARKLAERFEQISDALSGFSVASSADLAIAKLARMIERLASDSG